MRQCDVLTALDDVDGERIGTMGISMGSGHSWLSAMVEQRIRVLVGVSSFYTPSPRLVPQATRQALWARSSASCLT